jgi:hypothetical protein
MKAALIVAALTVAGAVRAADIVYDGGGLDRGAVLMFEGGGEVMLVPTGRLSAVSRQRRADGVNEVIFRMSEVDALRFEDLTTKAEGQVLRITMCDTVLAEPMVLLPITGGEVLITGGTDAATEELFAALEARRTCPETGGS